MTPIIIALYWFLSHPIQLLDIPKIPEPRILQETKIVPKKNKKVGPKNISKVPKKSEPNKIYDHTELFRRTCPDQMHILPLVCRKENASGNPGAIHTNRDGSRDYGICQLNQVHIARCGNLLDPVKNVQCACNIMREQGKNAWTEGRKIKQTGTGTFL